MLFGKEFIVLVEELPTVYRNVGDDYPEYFLGHKEKNEFEYLIIDDNFGQPSPANWCNTPYAKKLQARSEKILQELIDEGYIKLKE